MSNDPMDQIELRKSFSDLGALGLDTFRSVIREGGTSHEAFAVTAALFAGLMKGTVSDPPEDADA